MWYRVEGLGKVEDYYIKIDVIHILVEIDCLIVVAPWCGIHAVSDGGIVLWFELVFVWLALLIIN